MTKRPYAGALGSALMLVFMIAARPAGATAPTADKEQDDLLRVITTLVDVVIPSAVRDFEDLKSFKIASNLRSVPSWHTKLRLPERWESEIMDRGQSTELVLNFSSWPDKDGSWKFVGEGGAWLDSMYQGLCAVVSRELKNGWKRKSEKDRKVGEADPGTGDKTRWTRKDGLVVLIERNELWQNDFYGRQIRHRDINYIVHVGLNIHVIKPK